jgi:hypothetical protein
MMPWQDINHPSNKLRPRIKCLGCGKLGCVTYWGPWCFECNVERMTHLNKQFDVIAKVVLTS